MSVIAEQLTKVYGSQRAVDQISFNLEPGQITGLLGPNGAGKSTTMKILTCYIPQTSGKASVCGYDVTEHPLEVRRNVGYLPEHNPLYLDMYVKEYLAFIANLHHMGKQGPKAVGEMIERTGLTPERKKKIGQLSKGYRQRVGLAQALIHNPQVLILDEPTSGLDPNQVVEIRQLITEIGRERTVILSTHIMQEVEAMCQRVLIINKGKLVADDKTANLRQRVTGETIINVQFNGPITAEALSHIAGIQSATSLPNNSWILKGPSNEQLKEAVFNFAVQHQLVIMELRQEQQSLEHIFQQLTQNT